ncbi:MAG: DUF998 domain-containing protein [Gemmatimonadota bacterium]
MHSRVHTTAPVPRRLLLPLCWALAYTALFFGFTLIQGARRAGFDAWHQAVSALSLGPAGWLQSVNLVLFGLVLAATSLAWRPILRGGPGAVAYPVLTALAGFGFVLTGIIPQDPAPGYDPANLGLTAPTLPGLLHLAAAAVAALCSVAGLLVMARRFRRDGNWAGWPAYTWITAVATVLCVAAYGVGSTEPSGFAGTFERAAILLPAVWAAVFVRRLWRGTPFMRVFS